MQNVTGVRLRVGMPVNTPPGFIFLLSLAIFNTLRKPTAFPAGCTGGMEAYEGRPAIPPGVAVRADETRGARRVRCILSL